MGGCLFVVNGLMLEIILSGEIRRANPPSETRGTSDFGREAAKIAGATCFARGISEPDFPREDYLKH